jgi:hypothetical protein
VAGKKSVDAAPRDSRGLLRFYVSETVGRNMLSKYVGRAPPRSEDPIDRLSTRELQVLLMIGRGITTRETAGSLNLSVWTVESHRHSINAAESPNGHATDALRGPGARRTRVMRAALLVSNSL